MICKICGVNPAPKPEYHGLCTKCRVKKYDFSKGKRGAVIPQKGKTRISIFIDNTVLDEFRARADKAGTGYQTMMNDALRRYLSEADQPVTEKTLRPTGPNATNSPRYCAAAAASVATLPVARTRRRVHPYKNAGNGPNASRRYE